MAGKIPDFTATARAGTGKGAARQARRDGLVPGVVYGGEKDPQAITVEFKVLLKALKAGRFMSTLFNLKIEGQDDVRVICRGVQRDVVKDLPRHIDFLRLHRNTRINLFIPVEFINEETSVGLKRGGTVTTVRNEVELKVTADNIPESLIVDLENLDIGDIVHISDIDLPKGSRPMITDRDFVIANITEPSSLKSADDDEDEDEAVAEATEGGEEAATEE
ncbi:MAG: 50S ribosomal protein L25/general stress protein Ctc [Proteobacteria bacterium]|nr:50S ribosomal protein L25/general stress protein Ctc [Pseudomonadota bacterium]